MAGAARASGRGPSPPCRLGDGEEPGCKTRPELVRRRAGAGATGSWLRGRAWVNQRAVAIWRDRRILSPDRTRGGLGE